MKRRYLTGMFMLLAVSVAYGRDLPDHQAYSGATPVTSAKAPGASTQPIPGRVLFEDEQRGVPTFIWANPRKVHQSPYHGVEDSARWYLSQFSDAYGLTKAAHDTVYVRRVHDTGRGGVIVFFGQRIGRVEVMRNELKVLMKRDLSLVAISGNLHRAAVDQRLDFSLSYENALARALADYTGATVTAASLRDTGARRGDYRYLDIRTGSAALRSQVVLDEPARVKRVLYPMPDRVVPGYFVEILPRVAGRADTEGYSYVIAADDGRLLMRKNLVESDAFDYTVWADTTAPYTPLDGPQEDFTPHPTSVPDGSYPAFIPPVTITMEGFNTNPSGGVDPWLPAGATETLGNNVDAYADVVAPDGFDVGGDLRADVTAPGVFAYIYDTALEPFDSANQIKAAVTQLFYVNNWLHNFFYDSGFDEAAGNAQQDNFGRGGLEGDVLLAEGQDYGGRNNANMLARADGGSPRMQMYIWDGRSYRAVEEGGTSYATGTAAFGPSEFDLTADLILVDDGVGAGTPPDASVTDGCEPIVNNVAGAIALIDRGTCSFSLKARHALDAGAVGVIIANHTPGQAPPGMADSNPPLNPAIPTLSVTFEDGSYFKTELSSRPVTVRMYRETEHARDGTIDNAIIAHEWGHYIHRRLTSCASQQCGGQGEGWGDFISMFMMVRESDDMNRAFAMASYSTWLYGDDSAYFGIRRMPYSASTTYNALSLRHIANDQALPDTHPVSPASSPNSQVHNAGEIWATIMFQGYAALIEDTRGASPRYDFAEARRRMADYIVAGMQLAPVDATYTEQARAMLAAAFANDLDDYNLLAAAYASRGAGSCAEGPSRYSTDFIDVVEDFQVRGEMGNLSVTLGDDVISCDGDGFLDAGETGRVRVKFENTGEAPLAGTEVTVTTTNPNVSFVNGSSYVVGSTPQFGVSEVSFDITVSETLTSIDSLGLTVAVSNADACEALVEHVTTKSVNFDFGPTGIDTVDSPASTWTVLGLYSDIWSRTEATPGENVWHGVDSSFVSDTVLESPDFQVSATEDFIISFDHRYAFEADATYWWDGGVIEITSNGGVSWADISTLIDPSYDGTITDLGGNPLSNRMAYSGQSASFPSMTPMTLDLGTALAGQTVRIRFRIGTDVAVGSYGWDIDNITAQGVTNLPFSGMVEDDGECGGVPHADAGSDKTAAGGSNVALDASGSSDPDGDPLTYQWAQVSGPQMMLLDAGTVLARFTAPTVSEDTVLGFEVMVSDGTGVARDIVEITVLASDGGEPDAGPMDPDASPMDPDASPMDPDAGPGQPDAGTPIDGDGGGCCQASPEPPVGSMGLMFLVMLAVLRITRRRRA